MYQGTPYIYVPEGPEYEKSKVGVPPNKGTRLLQYGGEQKEVRTWIPYYLYDLGGWPCPTLVDSLPDVLKQVRGIYGDTNIKIKPGSSPGFNGNTYFLYHNGLTMFPMKAQGELPEESDYEKAKGDVFPEGTYQKDLNGYNVEYKLGFACNPKWSYNFAQQSYDPEANKHYTFFPQVSPYIIVEYTNSPGEDGGSTTTYYATSKQVYAVANRPRSHWNLIAWYRTGGRRMKFTFRKHWELADGTFRESEWEEGEVTTGEFREGFGEANVPYAVEIKPYPGIIKTVHSWVEVKSDQDTPPFQLINFFEND